MSIAQQTPVHHTAPHRITPYHIASHRIALHGISLNNIKWPSIARNGMASCSVDAYVGRIHMHGCLYACIGWLDVWLAGWLDGWMAGWLAAGVRLPPCSAAHPQPQRATAAFALRGCREWVSKGGLTITSTTYLSNCHSKRKKELHVQLNNH